MTLHADPERDAQIQGLLIGQTQFSCQLVHTDVGRQLLPQ
ncbi:unannotated protein [freshwater metagenome]|uniref:Unannotated protein n=1 Tax=freshwater metagenome TaxID=449393 RepID=A0A6J6XJA2_9ZZZZ